MSRFHGIIGYIYTEEVRPGVWEEVTVERKYYGNMTKKATSWSYGDSRIPNYELSTVLSVVADPFGFNHYNHIRYIAYMGQLWTVKNVDVQYPRIELTIGGIYNGPNTDD